MPLVLLLILISNSCNSSCADRGNRPAQGRAETSGLTDEQMLQYMGRENLEDYNADFLVMLETWESAVSHFSRTRAKKPEAIEVARILGWTRPHDKGRTGNRMNDTAEACNAAAKLISGGYLNRSDLKEVGVRAARDICTRIVTEHEALEKMAKVTNRSAKELETAKHYYGTAGKHVARSIREGRIANRDIRGNIDVEAFRQRPPGGRAFPGHPRATVMLPARLPAPRHQSPLAGVAQTAPPSPPTGRSPGSARARPLASHVRRLERTPAQG
jgi:hypothetical protein